jgi:hypothetical protein
VIARLRGGLKVPDFVARSVRFKSRYRLPTALPVRVSLFDNGRMEVIVGTSVSCIASGLPGAMALTARTKNLSEAKCYNRLLRKQLLAKRLRTT